MMSPAGWTGRDRKHATHGHSRMNLDQLILDLLNKAALPLKTADVTKQLKPMVGKLATAKAVTAALESMRAAGVLNCILTGTPSKPVPLYTTASDEAATDAILKQAVHAAKKEQPVANLKKKLPAALHPHFEGALVRLMAGNDLFVLSGAKRLVFAQRPKPAALLTATQRRALQKIFDSVNGARAQAVMMADFVIWLDGEPAVETALTPAAGVAMPDEADLHGWYEIDRARSSTMMIPIPQTFTHYAAWAAEHGCVADSQVLRNLIEILYNNGRILLEPCEKPQDLPDHERALLVPMSLGPPGYSWCWLS